jgi:hypothetical protein
MSSSPERNGRAPSCERCGEPLAGAAPSARFCRICEAQNEAWDLSDRETALYFVGLAVESAANIFRCTPEQVRKIVEVALRPGGMQGSADNAGEIAAGNI